MSGGSHGSHSNIDVCSVGLRGGCETDSPRFSSNSKIGLRSELHQHTECESGLYTNP